MKQLPLGIQTFRKIIEGNYLYIDKTKAIYRLIQSGEIFFLSRPRRFGKSLLVSTLKEIFLGNRPLFRELYIYDKIEWNKHPIIHIDFSVIAHTDSHVLETALNEFFEKTAHNYMVTFTGTALSDRFNNLIEALHNKYHQKVVVLVDEYDKPILDVISDSEKAKENREILRHLFTVLKGADQYLRFVFLTGVSKFSKVSVFSGLNNLRDITLSDEYSTLLGVEESELKKQFNDRLMILAKKENIAVKKLLQRIKYWYNGYSWNGVDQVYNPTSILNLFFDSRFSNYWFATGTPTFLIRLIREKQYAVSQIEEVQVTEEVFDTFDIEQMDINSLLLQTGYLTVNKVHVDKYSGISVYHLKYPNFEVKQSLLRYTMAAFVNKETAMIQPDHIRLVHALEKKDLNSFITLLTSIFAGIPYNLHIKDEKYYHSLCYMVLALMGAKIDLEVLSDKGRIDGVLTLDEIIYVIEFKMGTAKEAMQQIKERRYYEQFFKCGKEVYLLGVGGFVEKKITYCVEKA